MPVIEHITTEKEKQLERNLYQLEIQVNTVLELSKAIIQNIPESDLLIRYKQILSTEAHIGRMVFILKQDEAWEIKAQTLCQDFDFPDTDKLLDRYPRPTILEHKDRKKLHNMEYIIPVFVREKAICCVLIGEVQDTENFFHNFSFVTSITNLVATAIDNHRLMVRRLERERYRNQIDLASEVQKRIIPSEWPTQEHFKVSALYRPLHKVGGDYIDCFKLDNNRTAFCVADVSGMGIAAALVMSNFQGIVRHVLNSKLTLSNLVEIMNKSVIQTTKQEMTVTFFVGEYNRKTRLLQYINAGHVPPFYITKGKVTLMDKGTALLGAVEDLPSIEMGEILVDSDAFFMLFTDGVTDVMYESFDECCDEKLTTFVEDNYHLGPRPFNERLLSYLEELTQSTVLHDDVAVLTCEIKA